MELVGGMGEIQASIISSIPRSLQYFLKSIKSLFLVPGVSGSHIFKWEVSKLFQRKKLSFHDHIFLLISSEIQTLLQSLLFNKDCLQEN